MSRAQVLPPRVAVLVAGAESATETKGQELAARLQLPSVTAADPAYDFFLTVTDRRLELRAGQGRSLGPVYVDFVCGPVAYRRRVGGAPLLFRAVGPPAEGGLLDATAGLGRDAFWLACRGHRVTAVERSQIVAALLEDGLARAAREPKLAGVLERIRLLWADARDVLRSLIPAETPAVVYLDPMFPPKRNSALVKKESRILRQLVGADADARELFELARAVARRRVVVKRMRSAPPLAPDPTRTYRGRTTRFDVYDR